MAVTVTERWSDRGFGRDADRGRTARRGFDVTGVSSENAAIAADGIPQRNELHPQAGTRQVLVRSHRARRRGPSLYRVTVEYAEPQFSSRHEEEYEDPLLKPPRLMYVDINREIEIDSDKDGNPIVNSAREAFRNRATDYVTEFNLEVRVNEPFFDPILANELRLSVNETPLNIEGIQIANALEARLMRMRPDGEHELNSDYVTVLYEWNIRPRIFAPEGVSPHAIRVKDQGMMGAATDGASGFKLVHIYDTDEDDNPADPVTDDVPLDGAGAPLLGGLVLGEDDQTAASLSAPDGATVENRTNAKFLWYDPPRLTVKDHVGQLGL